MHWCSTSLSPHRPPNRSCVSTHPCSSVSPYSFLYSPTTRGSGGSWTWWFQAQLCQPPHACHMPQPSSQTCHNLFAFEGCPPLLNFPEMLVLPGQENPRMAGDRRDLWRSSKPQSHPAVVLQAAGGSLQPWTKEALHQPPSSVCNSTSVFWFMNPLAGLCCLFRNLSGLFLLHKDCISFNFLGNWAKKKLKHNECHSQIRACKQGCVNQMCAVKEATVQLNQTGSLWAPENLSQILDFWWTI